MAMILCVPVLIGICVIKDILCDIFRKGDRND